MIVVRVELWSAIDGSKTELARMHISNDGTNPNHRQGNYDGQSFRGRDTATLDKLTVQKTGRLINFPRLQLHVWNLVARMLNDMGYN